MKCEMAVVQLILHTETGREAARSYLDGFDRHALLSILAGKDAAGKLASAFNCQPELAFCALREAIRKRFHPGMNRPLNRLQHFGKLVYDPVAMKFLENYLEVSSQPLDHLFDRNRVRKSFEDSLEIPIDPSFDVARLLLDFGFKNGGFEAIEQALSLGPDDWGSILSRKRWLREQASKIICRKAGCSPGEVPGILALLIDGGLQLPAFDPESQELEFILNLNWTKKMDDNPDDPLNEKKDPQEEEIPPEEKGPPTDGYDTVSLNYLKAHFANIVTSLQEEALKNIDDSLLASDEELYSSKILKLHLQLFQFGHTHEALSTFLRLGTEQIRIRSLLEKDQYEELKNGGPEDSDAYLQVGEPEVFAMNPSQQSKPSGRLLDRVRSLISGARPEQQAKLLETRHSFLVSCPAADPTQGAVRIIQFRNIPEEISAYLRKEISNLKAGQLSMMGITLSERLLNTPIPIPGSRDESFQSRLKAAIESLGPKFTQMMVISGVAPPLPRISITEGLKNELPYTFPTADSFLVPGKDQAGISEELVQKFKTQGKEVRIVETK